MDADETVAIDALRRQKEQELKELSDYRTSVLEKQLEEKEQEVSTVKHQLQLLKDDFVYNLRLLEERDAELARYDASFAKYVKLLQDKDKELAEYKVTVANLRSEVRQEQASVSDLDAHFQSKVVALQQQLAEVEAEKQAALHAQKEEFAAVERQLRSELRDRKAVLASERIELAAQFEKALDVQAKDAAATEAEVREELEIYQQEAQQLALKLQHAKDEVEQHKKELEALQAANRGLEEAKRTAEWQLRAAEQDRLTALERCENTVADEKRKYLIALAGLEAQKTALEKRVHELEERLKGQRASYAHALEVEQKQKDSLVARMEASFAERSAVLNETISSLQGDLDAERTARRRAEGSLRQLQRAREEETQTSGGVAALQAEVAAKEVQLRQTQQEHAEARRELLSLHELVRNLQGTATARADAAAKCRVELEIAEAALQEEKRAVVDQRFELERQLAEKDEQLLDAQNAHALVEAQRDRAQASMQRLEQKLNRRTEEWERLRVQMAENTQKVEEEVRRLRAAAQQSELLLTHQQQPQQQHMTGNEVVMRSDDWDMGPASPVPSLPPSPYKGSANGNGGRTVFFPHGPPSRGPGSGTNRLSGGSGSVPSAGQRRGTVTVSADTAVDEVVQLREENTRLSETVRQMKIEMQNLVEVAAAANSKAGHSSGSAGSQHDRDHQYQQQYQVEEKERKDASSSHQQGQQEQLIAAVQWDSSISLQIHRLQQHVQLLTKQVEERDASASSSVMGRELSFLRRYVNELHGVVEVLRVEVNRARSQPFVAADEKTMRDLTRQNKVLRKQLSEAHQQLERLLGERERLLEISNLLRADLSKKAAPAPAPGAVGTRHTGVKGPVDTADVRPGDDNWTERENPWNVSKSMHQHGSGNGTGSSLKGGPGGAQVRPKAVPGAVTSRSQRPRAGPASAAAKAGKAARGVKLRNYAQPDASPITVLPRKPS